MNTKEKTKRIRQASRLYTLGLAVEKRRHILWRLVEKGTPYNSPQMNAAFEEFQKVNEEWKCLEKDHLDYRKQLGINP